MTARELISILKKMGFDIVRVKGSHYFLQHLDGRSTVIPVHAGETIGIGLMNKIMEDCNVTVENLRDYS
jgi:predicted RNA binding protein YcfA (HicA-like mRNA interferase family)